jgi:hypothetical protein
MRFLFSIFLFLSIVTTSYTQELQDLLGRWERVEGNFIGMKMEIQTNDTTTVGVLLADANSNYFEEGDVKWKGLKKTADGEFVVSSLYIELGINDEPIAYLYVEKVIWFISDDMICVMSTEYDEANSSGHIQYWVRQNSI